MKRHLIVERADPGLSVQDLGRHGHMGVGLSRGGAVDRAAFLQGLALTGNAPDAAALELSGTGGRFRAHGPSRIALTGAAMRASADGDPLEHNAIHALPDGATLDIGAPASGVYGYLHVAGGFDTEVTLGGRGFHRVAGLGRALAEGDRLPLGPDPAPDAAPMRLALPDAPKDPIRVMEGPQTELFPDDIRAAFEATTFTRSPRGNRQGVRLDHDSAPFSTGDQLQQVSDFICEGDIQMTGDGTPYVLLAECQTMGGYPRIGTVLPADLPRIAQAQPGARLKFRFIRLADAATTFQSDASRLAAYRKALTRKVRDPREMRDLLSYELIPKPLDD